MVDQEVIGSQLKSDRFPFQSEGDITLAIGTRDYVAYHHSKVAN